MYNIAVFYAVFSIVYWYFGGRNLDISTMYRKFIKEVFLPNLKKFVISVVGDYF